MQKFLIYMYWSECGITSLEFSFCGKFENRLQAREYARSLFPQYRYRLQIYPVR